MPVPSLNHPLNKRALALLKQMKQEPDPELSPLIQVLIDLHGLPDELKAGLYQFDQSKVLKTVAQALPVSRLADANPYQAAFLIAEAIELDLNGLDL